ncbi:MAG TPA: hypothetical protein VH853_20435 [Polyangia bacterium]|nr:hypothetical protein [Polyangia bacterium]
MCVLGGLLLFALAPHSARAEDAPATSPESGGPPALNLPPALNPPPPLNPPSPPSPLPPLAPSLAAATAPPAKPRYFYFGRDYGSQALYGPLWVFVNRGYDVLQDHVAGRNIFTFDYRTNTGNVFRNIRDPFPAIAADGWKTFLTEEIFPLSFTQSTARWTPNYSLHLIGGGMTYTSLREWFEDYGVPAPRVFSAVTLMASAFVNESLENKGFVGFNTDCIADIWVFDIGGIILFSFDWPNRFFSHTVVIADWSLQPSFTLPNGELHNVGNYFAAKWALPFYRRLSLFAWYGEATTGGLSFALDDEYSISASAGGAAIHLTNAATKSVENVVDFVPTGAIFLDRHNSLLASLQITNVDDYFIHFNIYPHAFTDRGPAVGVWGVVDKRARVAAGFAIGRPFGIGGGWSSL